MLQEPHTNLRMMLETRRNIMVLGAGLDAAKPAHRQGRDAHSCERMARGSHAKRARFEQATEAKSASGAARRRSRGVR